MSSVKDYHSEFSNNITVTVAKLSYSDTSGCQVGSTISQTAEGWRMRDREVSVIHTKNPVVHFKLRQAAKHVHLWRAAGRRRGTYWKKHQCWDEASAAGEESETSDQDAAEETWSEQDLNKLNYVREMFHMQTYYINK